MDGLGVVANVIAVVELSAKIASLCIQYSLAVKHAKADIERLGEKVNSVTDLLRAVEWQLQRPNNTQLSTSQKLHGVLQDCFSQLTQLNTKLDPGKTRKTISRFGIRALKWPFESKEVENVINDLERCKQTISLALQVDQATFIPSILPSAKRAAFDSYLNEHYARCLPNTRIGLRRKIVEWVEDAQGECIFWLNGMAGIGKSTISRTVAQSFADKGQLGASFFFKRGECDLNNAAKFFTTIAAQLAIKVPGMIPHIRRAIDSDPAISEKALKEQFEKLILQPLSKMQGVSPQAWRLVIVVDALDECEGENDIQTILLLLSQLRDMTLVCLRIFVTSRPELPIRLGFKKMKSGIYQDLVLHEISQATIEHDISAFLQHELTKIQVDHSLTIDWPGQENIQALVEMAVPLFIFAATVCRFIGDPRWDPKKRLATILEYQTASQASKLDKAYLPILDQLLVEQDDVEKEQVAREFQEVVGVIIVLANPLSTISLASLLRIPEDDIAYRLDLLHSVLSIPTNQAHPVRLLHPSFRDFLLDPLKREKSPFWVDERKTHERIASKCIQLLSECLKINICNIQRPGTLRSEIDSQIIGVCLPAEVQYACRYWVYHLEQSKSGIYDNSQVHIFLRGHLLHWLEAMSLLGIMSESITMITTLQSILEADKSPNLDAFVHDAKRFALYNRSVIEQAPLQLYCSALVFAPEMSIVQRQFEDCIPAWIQRKSKVQGNWSALLQTLEGHSHSVMSVAFSPDGKLVASASHDKTIRLWDTATGAVFNTLEGHSHSVISVAFSPDGKLIASASHDKTIKLWDAITGATLLTLEGHLNSVNSVAFSPDGKIVISGSDDQTVRFWNPVTGATLQTLEGHSDSVRSVAFSPGGQLVASASHDKTIRLWDTATGAARSTLEGHSDWVISVAFSPDGKLVASASYDKTIRLWDAVTGAAWRTLEGHSDSVRSVAFSPGGQLVASASHDKTIRLWDAVTGTALSTLEGHSDSVTLVAFSLDGKLVVSGSHDKTVRLWDAVTGLTLQTLEGHSDSVRSVAFSPDGKVVASGSDDKTVRLWDGVTRMALQTLEGHSDWVISVAFSPDGKLVASASHDKTIRLWDAVTGAARSTLEGHSDWVSAVAFSSDGQLVASASYDKMIKLWDVATGAAFRTLEGHSGRVLAVTFSSDGQRVASASDDKTVRIWDVATGAVLSTLEGHSGRVSTVAFSPDGQLVASGASDRTVLLWNAARKTLIGGTKSYAVTQKLIFSSDGSYLETDRGGLSFNSFSRDPFLLGPFYGLHVDENWVRLGAHGIVWLPPDYRTTCTAVYNDTIILGHASGNVSLLDFAQTLLAIQGLSNSTLQNLNEQGSNSRAEGASTYDGSTLFNSVIEALTEQTNPTISKYEGASTLAISLQEVDEQPDRPVEQVGKHKNMIIEAQTSDSDDIRSLVSDDVDISSTISSHITAKRAVAERQIAVMIAHSQDLLLMHNEARVLMSKDRFAENFRRLLKRYYLDLRETATSNLERATIELLRSRRARTRIARMVADMIMSDRDELHKEFEEQIRETHQKDRGDLEHWISEQKDLTLDAESSEVESWSPEERNNAQDAHKVKDINGADNIDTESQPSDTESDGDEPGTEEYGSDGTTFRKFPNVQQMEEFLMEGSAFQALSINFSIFVLPLDLRRLGTSIPADRIRFSAEDENSLSNRIKAFFEYHTDARWKWWPLKPRMPLLYPNQTRMHWQCFCGKYFWRDMSTSRANIVERQSRKRGTSSLWIGTRQSMRGKPVALTSAKELSNHASSSSSKTQKYIPPGASSLCPVPSRLTSTSATPSNAAVTSQLTTLRTDQTNRQVGATSNGGILNKELWILFGVQAGRKTLELCQISTEDYSELGFFQKLVETYRVARGFWRVWFSFWQFSHCEFVKFEKIGSNRIIFRCIGLPADPDYEYSPPEPPHVPIPPITPEEFELAFSSCPEQCSLSRLHDCFILENEDDIVARIPKKKSKLDVETKSRSVRFAWGIQAQYAISFIHVFIYHMLILAAPTGFWVWWQKRHPDDLQNASTPLATVIVLISLFWSTTGIFKRLREPQYG